MVRVWVRVKVFKVRKNDISNKKTHMNNAARLGPLFLRSTKKHTVIRAFACVVTRVVSIS